MLKVLLAVDGSDSASRAVAYAIKRAPAFKDGFQVHLINVQPSLHGSVSAFIDAAQIKQYHQEEGMKVLLPARGQLDAAGVSCLTHLFVGEPAEVIARLAKDLACDEIMLGTRGLSGISGLLVGSVATKVVHLADVPVLLIK
ncbi:MAG TPA: universal stress protein [Paucimonas sp.]|nr:universal stress protein [Paucimonas sp.]